MARSKGYGQFCPVAKAAEIVAERWAPLVLRELAAGSRRFNQLRHGVPLMSPSLLTDRLKRLERAGIVERIRAADGRAWEYHPTAAGRDLFPLIEGLGRWGRRWVRSDYGPDDLDPSLLMWDVRRRLDPAHFAGRDRTVIRCDLTGCRDRSMRRWWLVVEDGHVDLCLQDPGFPVDLVIVAGLRDPTRVWMGDLAVDAALRDGAIGLHGDRALERTFPRWFALSAFAQA